MKNSLPQNSEAVTSQSNSHSALENTVEATIAEREQLAALTSAVALCLIQRASLDSILTCTVEAILQHLDAAFVRIWTLNPQHDVLELRARAGLDTHPDSQDTRIPVGKFKIGLIAQSGQPLFTNEVSSDPRVHDHEWAKREGLVSYAGYPLIVEGNVVGVLSVFACRPFSQVTREALSVVSSGVALAIEHKETEAELREQSEVLETVNRIGQILSAELDLKKLVQAITDAATELTGAQFGSFFYNVLDEKGASYTLYTLSGVPEEKFSNFPMPRATDVFGPTFRGEGTIRLDNVKQDERYGRNDPYHGMPAGHLPVTSYLAVSVISRSGEVIGGLFFGHSEEGVFSQRHERIVEALASQAAIAMDNARLFEALERERAKAENAVQETQRLYNEALRTSQMKDDFLATISHELRTPLTAMLGWSSMLMAGQLDGQNAQRALESLYRNTQSQAQIIEDILDISRITTGKLRLDARLIDPKSVVEMAVDSMRPGADARGVRLQLLLDPQAGPVSGDPERLQQVVWNLVSNAVKFTPKGGRVQIRLERVNSHIEIIVSDSGMGITPEFLPYVFERFRQADSSSTRKYGGLGLGLSIVRQIVEMHGGEVVADSPGEGQGSTFTVKLPLAALNRQSWNDEAEEERVHPKVSGKPVGFDCPAQIRGLRILVVDDEEETCSLLNFILTECQAKVITAACAAEALQSVKSEQPDVLISDIGMPVTDGYELIRQIRQYESEQGLKKIPAIALTAFARVEDRMKALSVGFQMHVPKPVEPAELVTVIASLVDRIS